MKQTENGDSHPGSQASLQVLRTRGATAPPSVMMLLRCRQLQRFSAALSGGGSRSTTNRELVKPEHLARARLAQPSIEKLAEGEADWVLAWEQNHRSLLGFLNSKSFKSLSLPDDWEARSSSAGGSLQEPPRLPLALEEHEQVLRVKGQGHEGASDEARQHGTCVLVNGGLIHNLLDLSCT